MKVFQIIQKNFATMGFIPKEQQNRNRRLLKCIQIVYVIKYSIDTIFVGTYIFLEAESIDEYMESIFILAALVAVFCCFLSIIFKNDLLFDTIELTESELNNGNDFF